jgi:hypothetical protein
VRGFQPAIFETAGGKAALPIADGQAAIFFDIFVAPGFGPTRTKPLASACGTLY